MKDEEINGLLLDGFMFGIRLTQGVHELPLDGRHMVRLSQIAAGEVTLETSTEELRQKLLLASEGFLAEAEDLRRVAMEHERDFARHPGRRA